MAKTKKNIARKKKKQKSAVNESTAVNMETTESQPVAKADAKKAEEEKKAAADKKKKQPKKKEGGFFSSVGKAIKNTWTELKKVQWLTSEELAKASGAVAAIVSVFTLLTWIVDSGLGALTALILGI